MFMLMRQQYCYSTCCVKDKVKIPLGLKGSRGEVPHILNLAIRSEG
jgi:hypothetical protein